MSVGVSVGVGDGAQESLAGRRQSLAFSLSTWQAWLCAWQSTSGPHDLRWYVWGADTCGEFGGYVKDSSTTVHTTARHVRIWQEVLQPCASVGPGVIGAAVTETLSKSERTH